MACDVGIVVDHANSDDPIFTVAVQTPRGSLDVMAEVTLLGRTLVLTGLHIGGDPAEQWGAAALRDIVQGVMEQLDVDEIHIVGGVRTTGANPGRAPRPRRLRRAPQPQAAAGR
ncbi:hypothetical protein ASF27_01205 [Methylobacterium sp. Leaf102]|uniref:hypothetical protein n=1 Tax=Methylobacterium sp. Leaf102 TaxID=1736253 RepID=UPI0006FDD88F|nr:hypothetical protein [Methylobacterium sp. Leaf102]KQP34213.1 hypothetical protein ASF27_01205 [Methylobacterium sp. Leaf102]KQP62107.1 hypothetical protein ASF52_05460 [Methylobacterium sp. Leaf112]